MTARHRWSSTAVGDRRFQQGCLAASCINNHQTAIKWRKMRMMQLQQKLSEANSRARVIRDTLVSVHKK